MMSALFVGDTASTAVVALSPWIIPLIALAAKLTHDQTRNERRSEFPRRPDDRENAGREDRARDTSNASIETNMAIK